MLVKGGRHATFVELESPFGHDSFLLEVEPLQEMLEPFLSQTHLTAASDNIGNPSRLMATVTKPKKIRRFCMPDPFRGPDR